MWVAAAAATTTARRVDDEGTRARRRARGARCALCASPGGKAQSPRAPLKIHAIGEVASSFDRRAPGRRPAEVAAASHKAARSVGVPSRVNWRAVRCVRFRCTARRGCAARAATARRALRRRRSAAACADVTDRKWPLTARRHLAARLRARPCAAVHRQRGAHRATGPSASRASENDGIGASDCSAARRSAVEALAVGLAHAVGELEVEGCPV